MPQLKVQNQYKALITSSIASSGDVAFTVSSPPAYTNGFVVVSPDLSTQREVMYFHDVIGSTIYVRGENRTSPKSHTSTEAIQINDVAEIFNTFSDMISQAFYTEKTGGLNVKVWGGYVLYNGNQVAIADTNLTLADNTISYIKYTFSTNTISVDTSNTGNIKAVVTTLGGVITNIVYRFSKESLIDFTVAITGALPSQAGNAGKFLSTDATNTSWQSVVLPNATTTVKGVVEVATDTEAFTATATGATGAPLIMTPDQIQRLGRFGDGSDGNITLSVNTTLTRDMYYNNLTVNTGMTLNPDGFIIYVLGTLTLTGTAKIIRNGNAGAVGTTGGAGGAGGVALTVGPCGLSAGGTIGGTGQGSGVNGLNGVTAIAVNPSYSTSSGAVGGAGGASGTGLSGGNGGTAGIATRGINYNTVFPLWKIIATMYSPARRENQYGGIPSATGGGSGCTQGGTSGPGGGGGGGNGGIIFVYASVLAGTGTIESIGGAGGAGGVAGSGNRYIIWKVVENTKFILL